MGRKWTDEQKRQASQSHQERIAREKLRERPTPRVVPGSIHIQCTVSATIEELALLPPENAIALMAGIAQVIAANNKP